MQRMPQAIGAWAYDNGFEIPGNNPSRVVKRAHEQGMMRPESGIVDLGCGRNPRNALFLLNHGHWVDCVDVEPVDIPPPVVMFAAGRITAYEASVLDFNFEPGKYGGAVLARLIQYIGPKELPPFMERVAGSLEPEAALMMSYTAEGGIHEHAASYQIPTYEYPIEVVEEILGAAGFAELDIAEGERRSVGVPHDAHAVTYDITARLA